MSAAGLMLLATLTSTVPPPRPIAPCKPSVSARECAVFRELQLTIRDLDDARVEIVQLKEKLAARSPAVFAASVTPPPPSSRSSLRSWVLMTGAGALGAGAALTVIVVGTPDRPPLPAVGTAVLSGAIVGTLLHILLED